MMRGKLLTMTVLATCAAVPAVSKAAFVNSTTSTVIWNDTYEGAGRLGTTPATGLPSPASPGSYTTNAPGTGNTIVVTDTATAGIAAYDGSQFLSIIRPGMQNGDSVNGVAQQIQSGTGLTAKSLPTGASDTLALTFGLYVHDFGKVGTAGSGSVASLFLYNSDVVTAAGSSAPAALLQLNFYAEGAFGNSNRGDVRTGAGALLTTDFVPSAWNTIQLQHVNGTTSWSLILNDGEPIAITGTVGGTAAWDMFHWRAGGAGTTMYFDSAAVPEPAGVAVIGGALLALGARHGRRCRRSSH